MDEQKDLLLTAVSSFLNEMGLSGKKHNKSTQK